MHKMQGKDIKFNKILQKREESVSKERKIRNYDNIILFNLVRTCKIHILQDSVRLQKNLLAISLNIKPMQI